MGARSLTEQSYNNLRDRVDISFQCVGAAAANPTGLKSANALVTSVVRNSAGNFTITLADKWAALIGFQACILDTANATHYGINAVSETVSSTKTIIFQVWGAATGVAPAKVDVPATGTIKVILTVTNSQQKPAAF